MAIKITNLHRSVGRHWQFLYQLININCKIVPLNHDINTSEFWKLRPNNINVNELITQCQRLYHGGMLRDLDDLELLVLLRPHSLECDLLTWETMAQKQD